MRDKCFDLGRVSVLIEKLYEEDLLQEPFWDRPKEAEDWFFAQTIDKQAEIIHKIAYGIEDIENKLTEIMNICNGYDDLNQSWNDQK